MLLPNTKKEKELQKSGFEVIIGVDEVGRGPLAGPVVAGAAWVNPEILERDFEDRELIRDSKKLSEKQRDKIYKFIQESDDFVLGIGEVSVEMIDKINILNASLLAMRLAVDEVVNKVKSRKLKVKSQTPPKVSRDLETLTPFTPLRLNGYEGRAQGVVAESLKFCALIDGNRKIQNLEMEQRLFAKGDQRIFSIATASIYAKVYRDKLMMKYHQEFPEYGFDKHKGYGTKFHLEQLNKIGACAIHRKSFAPVKNVL